MPVSNPFLVAGAAGCFGAAALHFACLVASPSLFMVLGAGPVMARMAERGHWYPYTAAAVIGGILTVAAMYALSGAGIIRALPLLRPVLAVTAMVFLVRAVAFPWLKPFFPGNSTGFWLLSSGICLAIGLMFATGLWRMWFQQAHAG